MVQLKYYSRPKYEDVYNLANAACTRFERKVKFDLNGYASLYTWDRRHRKWQSRTWYAAERNAACLAI
jgi:hypothetical protein